MVKCKQCGDVIYDADTTSGVHQICMEPRIHALEATIAERDELLTLIRDDLRMRSEDGVVDISNFIWERLAALLK